MRIKSSKKLLIIVTILLSLLMSYLFMFNSYAEEQEYYKVIGNSMKPTVEEGDVVRLVPDKYDDGDIVIIETKDGLALKRLLKNMLVGDNPEKSDFYQKKDINILGKAEKIEKNEIEKVSNIEYLKEVNGMNRTFPSLPYITNGKQNVVIMYSPKDAYTGVDDAYFLFATTQDTPFILGHNAVADTSNYALVLNSSSIERWTYNPFSNQWTNMTSWDNTNLNILYYDGLGANRQILYSRGHIQDTVHGGYLFYANNIKSFEDHVRANYGKGAPSTPGTFITPAVGSNLYKANSYNLRWGASTDFRGLPIEYRVKAQYTKSNGQITTEEIITSSTRNTNVDYTIKNVSDYVSVRFMVDAKNATQTLYSPVRFSNWYTLSAIIDTTPPTINLSQNPTTWTNGNVTINISATDAGVGVKRIKLPNGNYVNGSSSSYPVSSNGNYTFQAEDNYGNIASKTISITNIDKVAPVISTSVSTSDWTNQNVTISISSSDAGIGVNRIKLPNGTYVSGSSSNYVVSSNGNYTFYVEDHLGNTSSKTVNISNIDKIAPTSTHEIVLKKEKEYVVKIDAQDDLSGVKRIKLPNGNYSQGAFVEYKVENNREYYFTIEDNAGNTHDYLVVSKIPSLMIYQKEDHVQTEWLTQVLGDDDIKNIDETRRTVKGEDVSSLPSSIEYNERGYKGILYPNGQPYLNSGTVGSTKDITFKEEPQLSTVFPVTKIYDKDGFTGTLNKDGDYYKDGEIVDSKTILDSKTSDKNSFVNTIPYNEDGYVGNLQKKGKETVIAGELVLADTKTVTEKRQTSQGGNPEDLVTSISYNRGDYVGKLLKKGSPVVISGKYVPADTKTVTEKKRTSQGGDPNSLTSSILYNLDDYIGTLNAVGQSQLVGGSSGGNKTVTDKRVSNTGSNESFPNNIQYNTDGYVGTLSKDGTFYQDGYNKETATATGHMTNGKNEFPITMSVDTEGYTGNIPKEGTSYPIDGTYIPDEQISMTETQQVMNKEDIVPIIRYLPVGWSGTIDGRAIIRFNSEFVGDLYPMGAPKLIKGSAESKSMNTVVTDNYYRPVKSQGPETLNYSQDGFKGTLNRTGTTYEKKPASIEIELTGSHFSTQPNIAMDISGMTQKAIALLQKAPYNYTGITFDRWEWKGSEQGPGSYYMGSEDGHLGEGDSSIEYKYKRQSSIFIKVDGYVYTSTYSGTVNKPVTDMWEQTFTGTITKPGSDTRVWRQNYKGEISKNTPKYSQNYKGNVIKPDTRIWERTYQGEVYQSNFDTRVWEQEYEGLVTKEGYDTRIWKQEYEGEVRKETPLYSQNYKGQVTKPDTRIYEQKYSGVIKKEAISNDISELYRNNELIYTGEGTDFEDFNATDKLAPNKINSSDLNILNGVVTLDMVRPDDIASNYQFQVKTVNNQGNKTSSNMEEVNIKSEFKGYSYVIDKNPSTIPDNIVNLLEDKIVTSIKDNAKYYIHVRAVDNKGNASETVHIPFQDNVAPILTLTSDVTEWTNGSIIITANASDALSGLKHIKLPNGNYHYGGTVKYTISENGSYTFVAEDLAGNTTSKTIVITNIDRTAPTKPIISNSEDWTNASQVPVSINHGTDVQSGVNRTEYMLTGATVTGWITYLEMFNITNEGVTKVTARTIDNLGHISEITNSNVRIDRTLPHATSIIINNNQGSTNSRSVTLTLSAMDSASGVSEMQFKNENGSWSTEEAYKTSKDWTLSSADGTKTVWVRYKDLAGNWSNPVKSTIELDMTAPIITKFMIQDGVDYYNSHSVYLNLVANDNLSGIKEVLISNDNRTWETKPYSEKINWTLASGDGNKTVYLKVVDNAGNTSSVKTDTIFIDTVKPTGSIIINNGNEQTMSRDVKLKISFSDNASGISLVKIVEGDREYIFPTVPSSPKVIDWRLSEGVGLKTVHLVLVDKAGNVSDDISDSIIVDKLSIERFTLTDVVNPVSFNMKSKFTPKEWTFEPQPMLSGANISFAIELKEAYDTSVVEDFVNYKVEIIGSGYHKALTGAMEHQGGDNYSKTITLPEDAPKGSKVYVIATATRELLVSPFDIQVEYFPGVEATTKAQIGTINGNINEEVRFNETN